MKHVRLGHSFLFGSVGILGASALLQAQIVNPIKAHITHKFIIANTTLPPGDYTFRMVSGSDLSAMTARSANGNEEMEFLVRQSDDNHRPKHSQLIFEKYGNHEILNKIYEGGDKAGVVVADISQIEKRLQKQGQKPVEHAEPPD